MKVSGKKTLGLAVMAFAAVAAVGCSSDMPEFAGLSSQAEFQEQAESLLQKNDVTVGSLQEYEYFEEGPVAVLKYDVSRNEERGMAIVSCSAKEILHMGTHCMMTSLKISAM